MGGGGGGGGLPSPKDVFDDPLDYFNPLTGLPSIATPGLYLPGQNPFAEEHKRLSEVFGQLSSDLGKLGLDSLSNEVGRWADQQRQIANVMNGKYHNDAKAIEAYKKIVDEYGNRLNSRVTQYNLGLQELLDRLERLVAFDEIFHMAYSNRIGDYQELNGPELEIMTQQYELMMRELNRLIAELKDNYDFVIGLTEGAFLQRIIGSVIMIIGGLHSDLDQIKSGDFDTKTFTRILMNVIAIVMVVISVFTYGLTLPVVLSIILLFLNLDGMYANGAATGAVMSALDFIFNDLLNLDELIGSDFEKFDKDHEDYQEMVGFVKLALALVIIITAWTSGGDSLNNTTDQTTAITPSSSKVSSISNTSTNSQSYMNGAVKVGDSFSNSSVLGLKLSTYADIYQAYSIAKDAYDVVGMNDQYKQMEAKLRSDYEKVNAAIETKWSKSMMKHYKDSAYFLQDQQEYIDRYLWSMTANNMYVDPYGTTPVANIRFTPDRDTRMMSFGFEDVFDDNTSAGSKGYFNNILYGGK